MKYVKILFAAFLLSSIFVGGSVYLSSQNNLFPFGNHERPAGSEALYASAEEYKPDRFRALTDSAIQEPNRQKNE